MMNERLKDKINNVKVDWDKEALWQELEPQLPRRKWISWRSLLGGLVLLMVVLCGRENIVNVHSLKETASDLSVNTINNEAKSVGKGQSSQLIASQNKHPDSKYDSSSSTPINQQAEEVEEVQTHNNTNLRETGYSSSAKLGNGYPEYSTWSANANESSMLTHQHSVTNILATANSDVPAKVPALTLTIPKAPLEEKRITETSIVVNTAIKGIQLSTSQYETLGTTSSLPMLWNDRLYSKTAPLTELESKVTPIANKWSGPQRGIYVALSAGIGTLSRSAEAKTLDPVESNALLENKMQEQTQFNSFGILGIGYQMKSGLFLETGLMYSEKQEQLNWQQIINRDTVEFFNELAYYSKDEFGDTTFYGGFSERFEDTKREIRHWNKLKTYQIPLVVGYDQQLNKFSVRGSLGVIVNVAGNFKGRIIDADQEVVDNPELILRSNFGYLANVGVGYQVLGRHQLFVNAAYHRSPKVELLTIKQYYQSFNVELGLRFSLAGSGLDQGIAKSQ